MNTITEKALVEALAAAGSAHHEFETVYLKGVYDEAWPGWYGAFVIGRLGRFVEPSKLATLLAEASGEGNWAEFAAKHVMANL